MLANGFHYLQCKETKFFSASQRNFPIIVEDFPYNQTKIVKKIIAKYIPSHLRVYISLLSSESLKCDYYFQG